MPAEQESPAEKLLGYIESQGIEFSHYGDANPKVLASFYARGIYQHHEVDSPFFKSYLRWLYMDQPGNTKPASSAAITEVVNQLHSDALFNTETSVAHVGLRVAGHPDLNGTLGGPVFVDLCNHGWQVVEIDGNGWRVIDAKKCPIKFTRSKGMESLPMPRQGGDLGMLREFVNVSEDQWPLVLGWLLSTLQPCGPYPILLVTGEQGSAKSTLSKTLRQLVDPNQALSRLLPSSEHNLILSAQNGHILSFDNVDGLKASFSDCLCSIATGAGYATRKLYTDADEMIFSKSRAIVMNGIANVGSRPDLLDRAYVLNLRPIPKRSRKTESQLKASFNAKKSRIFGALLDAVSCSIKNYRRTNIEEPPRMADAATWATAAEPASGLRPGDFMRALRYNRDLGVEVAIASDPIASSLIKLMDRHRTWSGTATELLGELDAIGGLRTSRDVGWPKTPDKLAHSLKRIEPLIRESGFVIRRDKDTTGNHRLTTIRRTGSRIPQHYLRHRDAMKAARDLRETTRPARSDAA